MNTKNFLLTLALGAVSTLISACGDEQESYADPDLVIASEVVNHGQAEEVSVTDNGTAGTTLSYETWIAVKQQFADGHSSGGATTRASGSGNGVVISVVLTNELSNPSLTAVVEDFELKEAESLISYKELGSSRHATQKYVTVIDSALVYKVDRGVFSIDFVLPYQVAVYDDGVTKATMPYHKYSEITDLGGDMDDLDIITEDEQLYERKHYLHSIVARFNGRDYTLTADIVLKKPVSVDYLVSRKVIDSGVELKSYDVQSKTGISRSWLKMEELWSLSGTKITTVEVLLNNGLPDNNYRNLSLSVREKVPYASLTLGEVAKTVSEQDKRTEGKFEITPYVLTYKVPVSTPDGTKDNFMFGVAFEKAVYADGNFRYEMPSLEYGGAVAAMSLLKDWEVSENAPYSYVMKLALNTVIPFGSTQYTYTTTGEVVYVDYEK